MLLDFVERFILFTQTGIATSNILAAAIEQLQLLFLWQRIIGSSKLGPFSEKACLA